MVNVDVESFIPGDLYQGFIATGASEEWQDVLLPFSQLLVTSAGRPRDVQRSLDGGVRITTLGLAIADDREGPFRIEVASVSSVKDLPYDTAPRRPRVIDDPARQLPSIAGEDRAVPPAVRARDSGPPPSERWKGML